MSKKTLWRRQWRKVSLAELIAFVQGKTPTDNPEYASYSDPSGDTTERAFFEDNTGILIASQPGWSSDSGTSWAGELDYYVCEKVAEVKPCE